MNILVTRPLREAQSTAQALRARGHDVTINPVLEIIGTGASITGTWDGVIVTSAQVFDHLDAKLCEDIRALPLFVVGARSAQAAKACDFGDAQIVASQVSELIASLKKRTPQRFLYLAGHDRKSDLENGLTNSGHIITPLIIYEARAVEELAPDTITYLRNGKIDAVLHYSRRSAELFYKLAQEAGLNEQLSKLRHICISADAAGPFADTAVIAKTPDQEGLFAALELR